MIEKLMKYEGGPCGGQFIVTLPKWKVRRAYVLGYAALPIGLVVSLAVESTKKPGVWYPVIGPADLLLRAPYTPEMLELLTGQLNSVRDTFTPSPDELAAAFDPLADLPVLPIPSGGYLN